MLNNFALKGIENRSLAVNNLFFLISNPKYVLMNQLKNNPVANCREPQFKSSGFALLYNKVAKNEPTTFTTENKESMTNENLMTL